VVDGIGGTLKRPVWLEILAGKRCSSAEGFVKISRVKTKAISVILVRQAQLDVTKTTLAKVFSNISNITNLQKQHSIKVFNKRRSVCFSILPLYISLLMYIHVFHQSLCDNE
jgi:hypothetical protein